jgi:hypothetical protein
MFDAMEQELPGRVYGLPERSVYEGLDADAALLKRTGGTAGRVDAGIGAGAGMEIGRPDGAGKGKARAGTEAMNVDS